MHPVVRFSLTAGAVALVCACTSDSVNPPIGKPQASFSDGAHGGNPDFFFLPPIFTTPTTNPNFSPGEFNAGVRPTVEICELAPLVPPATLRACATTIKTFAAGDIQLDATNEQYQVNWQTDQSNLALTKEYRVRAILGTQELGHADLDPVLTGGALKNMVTGDFITLVNGRTLPIKFRIENGAACRGGDCDSKTIDLSRGGFVVLETTGDRVDIPAQQSGQVVTVTVQQCANLDIDLPVFGNCLRVTADPVLRAVLAPKATVSICSLDPLSLPLVHAQQDLLTLHRQDDELVIALPHSDDFCETPIGRSRSNAPTNFAARGWRAVRDAAAWIFQPATLHASTMVLDVGAGGQTDGFSDFQFALPAKMDISSLVDQVTDPNTAVRSVPSVYVTDADGNPVSGARVHYQITSTGGGSVAPVTGIALSDASGRAALTQWMLGAAGSHTLQASGKGIADRRNNGPAEGFDPFAPAVLHNAEQDEAQPPVSLSTGRVAFLATAATSTTLVNCASVPGGDEIGRGFYIPAFPGTLLTRATMSFSSRTAGTYTLRMTVRSGTYDGAVLGTATTQVALTADDLVNVAATFAFDAAHVTAGSAVTFSLEIVDGPSSVVFYAVPGQGDLTCPVVQTNGTTPPLDSFRRQGVGITVEGASSAPPIP